MQEGKAEMKPVMQSALILLATLFIGFAVGALATGLLERNRRARVERLRERGGFVEHLQRVIRPRDDEQRSAVLPILRATARRNSEIIESAHGELRTALEEMIVELEPLLDAEQRRRLVAAGRIPDPFRPPPPPGDRPPPPR